MFSTKTCEEYVIPRWPGTGMPLEAGPLEDLNHHPVLGVLLAQWITKDCKPAELLPVGPEAIAHVVVCLREIAAGGTCRLWCLLECRAMGMGCCPFSSEAPEEDHRLALHVGVPLKPSPLEPLNHSSPLGVIVWACQWVAKVWQPPSLLPGCSEGATEVVVGLGKEIAIEAILNFILSSDN